MNLQGQNQNAELKPYVRCPSAMKCVEKNLCDFEGFMTDQPLDLTPDLEMLRVPLIVIKSNFNEMLFLHLNFCSLVLIVIEETALMFVVGIDHLICGSEIVFES